MKKKMILILGGVGIVAVLGVVLAFYTQFYKLAEIYFKYGGADSFSDVYPTIKDNLQFLEVNPLNDGVYYSLGQGFYGLGGFNDAVEAFKKATEINPNRDYYWSFLGKAYQAKKDYKNSIEAYGEALKISPNKQGNYTQLAWLYYFRTDDEMEKAYDVLKQGLEKFPDNKDILWDITRYYLYDKNMEEFAKYAPLYLKIDPEQELIKSEYEKLINK